MFCCFGFLETELNITNYKPWTVKTNINPAVKRLRQPKGPHLTFDHSLDSDLYAFTRVPCRLSSHITFQKEWKQVIKISHFVKNSP